jgi:hypothetical protein
MISWLFSALCYFKNYNNLIRLSFISVLLLSLFALLLKILGMNVFPVEFMFWPRFLTLLSHLGAGCSSAGEAGTKAEGGAGVKAGLCWFLLFRAVLLH